MSDKYSIKVCRGIIQYLINSARYTPKQIANLTTLSIENVQFIYYDNILPESAGIQIQLLNLYSIVIELRENDLRIDI